MSAERRSWDKHDRPPASAAEAAQRLARIVDAAERAAASVIDEAEQQARRRLEEARRQADRIAAERLRELADELDPPSPAAGGPRLLATQMAVSGASREEIDERLRESFGIEDTGEILDAILGPAD